MIVNARDARQRDVYVSLSSTSVVEKGKYRAQEKLLTTSGSEGLIYLEQMQRPPDKTMTWQTRPKA